MRHRLPLACFVVLVVAFTVLLSRPGSSASAPISESDGSSQRSTTSSITTITTDTITIPTYPYAAYLYTATNTTYNIPYRWLHWAQYQGSNPQLADKTYTRLTLENDWLRVSLLPELGGRVYEMIFKSTGNNELYRNPVIKPTHWGPSEQGWWLAAGGLEWGLPVEEHGYESAIPWMYDVITGTDGITVTLRDSVQPDRLRATISVFLPNDRAVLIVHPRIENDRAVDLNFKWWDNAMLAPGPGNSIGKQGGNPNNIDLKFVFPESQVTVHSTGDPTLPQEGQAMSWPIYKNVDRSRVQNWDQWLGFFARPAASQDWVSVIDQAHQEGLVRIFPRSIAQGSKGFAMGWRHPIGAGEWTNDDSYYAELHGGLAPTFWDSALLGAHQAIEWEETWYPIAALADLSQADGHTAFYAGQMRDVYESLEVGVHTTQPISDALVSVYHRTLTGCDRMTERYRDLMTPATPFSYTYPVRIPPHEIAVSVTRHDQPAAQYNVTNDGQPPTISIYGLPLTTTQTSFPVDVIGRDPDCVRSLDVQVKDGSDGLWTPWLTAATQTINWFDGEDGHTYFFRARARDLAGNESRYTTNPLGNGMISVLVTPAPVLETSVKGVDSPLILWSPIGWSIDLWNSGNFSTTATLTDTLPSFTSILTDAIWLNGNPAPQLYVAGQLRWSGTVTENAHIYITYHLSPTLPLTPGTILTNTAVIAYNNRIITRTAQTAQPYQIALPLIRRNTP